MADNLPVSQLQDKDGVTYDIAAKRMSGTRTISITGDITGSVTTNLGGAVAIDVGIADNAVDTSCIADGAVTTSCIADNNVTLQKLSSEVRTSIGQAHTHSNKDELDNYAAAGSASVPIYVAEDGTPTACTDDFARDSELAAETSARTAADTTLQTNITNEASTRASADTALGSRITTLEGKTKLSDFTDDITVDTYSSSSEAPISGKGVAAVLKSSTNGIGYIGQGSFPAQNGGIVCQVPFNVDATSVVLKVLIKCTQSPYEYLIRVTKAADSSSGVGAITVQAATTASYPYNVYCRYLKVLDEDSSTTGVIKIAVGAAGYYSTYQVWARMLSSGAGSPTVINYSTITSDYTSVDVRVNASLVRGTAVGSSTVPVYVTAEGAVTACTDDFVHDAELTAGLATKQNTLTFDTTPTASSTNPVTSGGIKTALDTKYFLNATLLTSEDNIDVTGSKLSWSVPGITVCYFSGNNISGTLPTEESTTANNLLLVQNTRSAGRVEQELDYGYKDFVYSRVRTSDGWSTWVKSYYEATSTYSSTGTAPVNGTAVAAAITPYLPASSSHSPVSSISYKKLGAITNSNGNRDDQVTLDVTFKILTGTSYPSNTWVRVVAGYRNNNDSPRTTTAPFIKAYGPSNITNSIDFEIVTHNAESGTTTTADVYMIFKIRGGIYYNYDVRFVSGSSFTASYDSSETTTEPTGTAIVVAQWITSVNRTDAAAVGSSTAPVYVDANGQVTACGSSLAVDITGKAATATKATQDASGNVITTTYATKTEVNSRMNVTTVSVAADTPVALSSYTNVGVYNFTSNSIAIFSDAPTKPETGVSMTGNNATMIVSSARGRTHQLLEYSDTDGKCYWFARSLYGSSVAAWQYIILGRNIVKSEGISSFASDDTNAYTGKAVSDYLSSSYVPLSMLKGSGEATSFDTDDTNAYTGKAISQKISDAISGNIGGWLGNKTVAEINALASSSLKSGDYATMTDAGTITLGTVTVAAGDEIYWVPGSSVWQKKDNSVYVKKSDIAKSGSVGVVKSSSTDGAIGVDSDGVMTVNGWSTVKSGISTNATNITTLQGTTAGHTTDIATINSTIAAMDLSTLGGDGKYIKSITQTDGKVTAVEATLDTNVADYGDNAPTTAAVKTYVDAQVTAETTARTTADTTLQSNIDSEATARESADTALGTRITTLEGKTKLSDFTDDITTSTYSATGTAPVNGTAVASAVSAAIATEVANRNTAIANGTWDAVYNPTSETLQFTNLSFTTSS